MHRAVVARSHIKLEERVDLEAQEKLTQKLVYSLIHRVLEEAMSFHLRLYIKTCTKLMQQWLDYSKKLPPQVDK